MAMKFGEPETDRIYGEHFKAAVQETGFELRRNDESQRAGLIDDLMRVQIRQSRFVIADLTDHSNGAYWEAGYAEGLGKPVIYTCRKDVFEDPTGGAHFDTNHHLTVVWDPADMTRAVAQLKATIRATLPEDARFEPLFLE
jgi:nucleoside 2-deoxyribosyltransferase